MKKLLLLLLLLPFIGVGQINNFPWIHDFENVIPLEQDTNDYGDWWLAQGPTSSFNTGPMGDHTTGSGIYSYVESSTPNYPNHDFIQYTPEFDVSATPGKVLSFWYHMHGAAMGDLEVFIVEDTSWTSIAFISGSQGNLWKLAYIPLDSFYIANDFKIAFEGVTGYSFTSDIAIDDIMISDPYPVIFGCTDSIAPNYDPNATINDGSCIYIYGCIDPGADNYNPFANVDDGMCIITDCDTIFETLITIILTLDDYPGETSWILTDISTGQPIDAVTQGSYTYADANKTFTYGICVPLTGFEFILNDSYGDGLAGSGTGGQNDGDCRIMDCDGDTIWQLPNPNFGNVAYSGAQWPVACVPAIVLGCTDPSYIEYVDSANVDDGSCLTLHTYGCTDPSAFNYDSTATMNSIEPYCNYWLTLEDDAGDGWGASYIGVVQGDHLQRTFRLGPGIFSQSFWLDSLTTDEEIQVYYFEIATGQQSPAQVSFQTLHNSFTLVNDYGDTLMAEGTNPFYNNGQGALQNFEAPEYMIYDATPYCGDNCIETVYGCTDSTALNYADSANVDDGTCIPIVLGCMNPLAFNYDSLATVDDSSCVTTIVGCMDSTAFNYNPIANVNDSASCVPVTLGCMDNTMFNYNSAANVSDSSCIPFIYGCTSPIAFNYDSLANTDDGSCVPIVLGCTDLTMWNYNLLANTDDGSCIPFIYGCTDPLMWNYDAFANTDNGSCLPFIYGCTDSTQFNYDPLANTDNNSCIPFIYGCTNPIALNFDATANTNDFSCILPIYGCMDSTAYNYNPLANVDNGTCVPVVLGCTNPVALNYDPNANVDDFSCILPIYGCTDSTAFNYDPLANVDNGGCIPVILGCTNPLALNYDPNANTDDFSCVLPIYGCTDSTMFNYNPLANVDNNSCIPFIYGCTDPTAFNYNPSANTEDFSCIPVVYGCMDSLALNYDSLANTDNGSCVTIVVGCMDAAAYNYDATANVSDSLSCLYDAGCVTGAGNPYWLNNPCYAWVIEIDTYCCNTEWDNICQATYDYCEGTWIGPLPARVENNIVVYPNPVNQLININTIVDVEVYNNIGEILISKKQINVLDVSKMSPGAYILRIKHNDKYTYKQIIKK